MYCNQVWIKKCILSEINTRTGRLKKPKFMKESLQIEYDMQLNEAVQENSKSDKKWINGNQEQWKQRSCANAVITATENTKTVISKEVN